MAQIYNPPSEIKVPELDFRDFGAYEKSCKKFTTELKAFVKGRKKGKHIGEIIRFPVADGHAEYMVASLSPVELVHIPLGDAWEFGYAHLMTKKEIVEQIERQKAIAKIFGK